MATHARYQIEEAKSFLGAPDGLPGHLTGGEQGYASLFIAELRRTRDAENGVSYAEIPGAEAWRQYLDPCVRRMERELMLGSDSPKLRRDSAETEFRKRRDEEIRQFVPNTATDCDPRSTDCVEVLSEVLDRGLAPFGFERDDYRSTEFLPVYSKPVTDEWAFCWSPELDKTFRTLPRLARKGAEPRTGLNLRYYLAPKRRRTRIVNPLGFATSDIVIVRHEFIVPGFAHAYSYFRALKELRVIAMAHMALYERLHAQIEVAIVPMLRAVVAD